jgi:hypothetical protein
MLSALFLGGCEAIERENQRQADLLAECAAKVVARTAKDSLRTQTACLTIEKERADNLNAAIILHGVVR